MKRILAFLLALTVSVVLFQGAGVAAPLGVYQGGKEALLAQRSKKKGRRRLRVPARPKIASVGVRSGVVARQPTNVSVHLEGLGKNAQFEFVRVLSAFSRRVQCYYRRNPNIGLQSRHRADQNGRYRLTIPGWFILKAYTNPHKNCFLGVEIKRPVRVSGKRLMRAVRLESGRIEIAKRRLYTVRKTWRLQKRLNFKKVAAYGKCTGTTLPVPKRHKVGVRKFNDDISIHVRSSAIGTDCQFSSSGWLLPSGVEVVSVDYKVVKYKKKCCIANAFGGACVTNFGPNVITSVNLNRGAANVIRGKKGGNTYAITTYGKDFKRHGKSVRENTSRPRGLATYLQPMWTRLQCANALTNNHGVRLILRSVTFSGPAGLKFP